VQGGKEHVNAGVIEYVEILGPGIGCHYRKAGLLQRLGHTPATGNADLAFGTDPTCEYGYF
jgi:hypothetical protein